jgi:hypothetical protein
MGLMPVRITTFFHAYNQLVYLNSVQFSSQNVSLQEENDQAFHVS